MMIIMMTSTSIVQVSDDMRTDHLTTIHSNPDHETDIVATTCYTLRMVVVSKFECCSFNFITAGSTHSISAVVPLTAPALSVNPK